MRSTASFFRIIIFLFVAFVILEIVVDSGSQMAIIKYPIISIAFAIIAFLYVLVEVCITALKSVLFRGLSPEAQERYLAAEAERKAKQFAGIKRLYKKMLGSKPIEEEHEIILDHNYDGIKELDNDLPPWWLYGFYFTILFGVIYMFRYHVFNAPNQAREYEIEVAEARAAIEEYKRTAKDLVDVNTVTLLTDASDLTAGKAVFDLNCVACHKADGGGGIGPNLTDPYWILGGGIKNVYRTISEGGRDGRGMIAWKQTLKPSEMAQVASYILSLQGTSPADPKAAEGEIWTDPEAPAEALDSLKKTEEISDTIPSNPN